MEAERILVPAKNDWRLAMCVLDPAEKRIAANDNVARALRVLRWDRRLRIAKRIGFGLMCVFLLGVALLAINQAAPFWALLFTGGALVAFFGGVGK